MDMFKFGSSNPPAPQQNQQPAQPGNISPNPPALQAVPGQGTTPVTDTPASESTSKSPLDQYTDLWKTDANQTTTPAPLFNVDQNKLLEAASKNDFSKVLSPELVQKIQSGGADAMQAMLQAMNQMSQNVYAQNAFATTKILEQALEKQAKAFEEKLPSIIKSQNVSDNLRNENPIFKHPAAATMLDSLKAQVAIKYPDATAQEQMKMAQDYLISFAQVASPAAATKSESKSGEVDWSRFELN